MPEDLGTPRRSDALQAGVLGATHCALTVDSASQVTVAAGVVWVNASGVLVCTTPVSTVLGSIPAAVNNRIDQVVVDSAGVVTRLAGTSDLAGNTLAANPQTGGGRATVPAGSKLLHDIQVTSAGVQAANRRDRRPWARGAFRRILRNANAGGGQDYVPGSALAAIDATNLTVRIECSGAPVRLSFQGRAGVPNATTIVMAAYIDGTPVDGAGSVGEGIAGFGNSGNGAADFNLSWDQVTIPPAGSHIFAPAWRSSGGGLLYARNVIPVNFTIEELVRQDADNT